jgi:hypothetical protein
MEVFHRSRTSSEAFNDLIINSPEIYVLNIRGNQLMLHLAGCGHFKFRVTDQITFARKLVSSSRDELNAWAKNEPGKHYSICRSCKP